MINIKHNRFVSTPDWFAGHETAPKPKETLQVFNISNFGSSGITGVTLYNKFALTPQELVLELLVLLDQAIVAIPYEELNDEGEIVIRLIGDIVEQEGWATCEYTLVAANTTMVITGTRHTNYGIVFYDYNYQIVSAEIFDTNKFPVHTSVPDNTYYFRISSLSEHDDFKVEYSSPKPYSIDQLRITHLNTSDFKDTNSNIPDGIVSKQLSSSQFGFLVENPLYLHTDLLGTIRLSFDYDALPKDDPNDMFIWDKTYSAFGYDTATEKAYSYTEDVLDMEKNELGELILDENGNPIPVLTDDKTKWKFDDNLSDKWIIRSTRQKLSLLDGLMEYDPVKDSFLFHKHIVTTGGVTQYADLDDIKLPDLYDGLPIDNSTIFWKYSENGKKRVLAADISEIEIDGEKFVKKDEWDKFLGTIDDADKKINTWKDLTDFLYGFTEDVNLKKYLDDYAHKKKDEPIEGVYNFQKGVKINDKFLHYDKEKNVWKFEGNIAATGGVTMYYNDELLPDPDILEQLAVYPPLYKEDGMLKINTSVLGGDGEQTNILGVLNGDVVRKKFMNGLQLSADGKVLVAYKKEIEVDDIADIKNKYVDLESDQDIRGWKNFITGLKLNGTKLYQVKEGTVYLDGNLVLKGGVTMYGDIDSDIPSILESIPPASYGQRGLASFDSKQFSVIDGHVKLLDGGIGQVKNPLHLIAGTKSYTFNGSEYLSINLDSIYLMLSGGTMKGTITAQDIIPKLTDTYSLGNDSKQWSTVYTKRLKLDGIDIYQSKEDVIYINSNLVVRGGISMYGVGETDAPNILDSIPIAGSKTPGLAAFNSSDFRIDENGIVSIISKDNGLGIKGPLSIIVNNANYYYDGSKALSVKIDYTTLGLDDRYLRSDNIISILNDNSFRQIKEVSEEDVDDAEILYIITS